jgi:hypothetical protein
MFTDMAGKLISSVIILISTRPYFLNLVLKKVFIIIPVH